MIFRCFSCDTEIECNQDNSEIICPKCKFEYFYGHQDILPIKGEEN